VTYRVIRGSLPGGKACDQGKSDQIKVNPTKISLFLTSAGLTTGTKVSRLRVENFKAGISWGVSSGCSTLNFLTFKKETRIARLTVETTESASLPPFVKFEESVVSSFGSGAAGPACGLMRGKRVRKAAYVGYLVQP
jgi:hypothetical protein